MKTNQPKKIERMTRWYVLPRFGSCKPTPRWGGHKGRVSFNPSLSQTVPRTEWAFSSQINREQNLPARTTTQLVSLALVTSEYWSQERMKERKQSKRKSSNEHYKSLSLVTNALCGVRRGFDLFWCAFAMNASSCIVVGSWKTWMQWMVGWLGYL